MLEATSITPVESTRLIPPARFLVTQTVLWQPTYGQAVDVVPHRDGSFSRVLYTDEQVWSRIFTVGKEWEPIDLSWVGDAGHCAHLILLNEEGTFQQRIPTPEVRKATFAKFLEVGIGSEDNHILIAPLENARFTPGKLNLFIRCPHGPGRARVVAIPGDEVLIDG